MNGLITRAIKNREGILKALISLFIVVQVSLTIAFLSPKSIAFTHAIADAATFHWKFAGMWQGWELFAPEIRGQNTHSVALITYEDGSTAEWPMPRTDQFDLAQKYRGDKFRKWNGDNAQWSRYQEFWPDLARYVAKLHYNGSGPKPATFMLLNFSAAVAKPEPNHNRLESPLRTHTRAAFFYQYTPEDFAK